MAEEALGTGCESEWTAPLARADAHGYRRPLPDFSTNPLENSANDRADQGNVERRGLSGAMDAAFPRTNRLPNLGIAVKSIFGFWLLYVTLITIRAVVLQYPDFWPMLARRTVVTAFGMLITFLIYLALRPVESSNLKRKTVWAGLLSLPASVLFASFNYYAFYVFHPLPSVMKESMHGMEKMSALQMAVAGIGDTSLQWYFLFAAWAAFYGAMSYSTQLRAADRRAAVLEREAQDAQLRALRYQINPHFLFNTLNSLSSLVLSQRNDTAERMIINLSTFFRTTLSADPTADITLEEEIRLQRLYLEIEQIRFPDRLHVEVDVPDQLLRARVPVLLLQPVVENAVKYGVARSRRPVTLRISAYEEAGRLHIKVKDDGETPSNGGEASPGSGVGLRNVCDRLIARYGAQAGCFHGPDPEGGFTVHVILPVVRNAG